MTHLFARGALVAVIGFVLPLGYWQCPPPIQDHDRDPRRMATDEPALEERADEDDDVDVEPPPAAPPWQEGEPIELVVVRERDPWLLTVATPIVSKLASRGKAPLLLVAPPRPLADTVLVKRLAPRRCLVLTSARTAALQRSVKGLPGELVHTSSQATLTSVALAKRFWGSSNEAIVASMSDPGGMLLGSALAAHLGVPFVPLEEQCDTETLQEALDSLGVKHLLVASVSQEAFPIVVRALRQKVVELNRQAIEHRLIAQLGADQIRNVILTRAPAGHENGSAGSWLAPYLSLIRAAPVVLCNSADGREAQDRATRLIDTHSLKPRSVTILGGYDAIGTIPLRNPEILGDDEVDVEPCAAPVRGYAAPLAVGRIPCATLARASLLIARSAARERLLRGSEARVLMVANPRTEFGSLPLAETVARGTAAEFKNVNVPVDEFYGVPSDNPPVLAAATKARLIIFQGHIYDQRLFPDAVEPAPIPVAPPSGVLVEVAPAGAADDADLPEDEQAPPAEFVDDPAVGQPQEARPAAEPAEEAPPDWPWYDAPRERSPPSSLVVHAENVVPLQARQELEGLPLVVMQSCHSLGEPLAVRVFDLGAVGLIGSTTNIHSASGSSFIKALCDGMLYRGDTVGEALRDARNYFLCLAQLKARRGHKEVAKGYRAALSFRLWGDPELRILSQSVEKPKRKVLAAKFVGTRKVRIAVPARRLGKPETEKYFIRTLPGAQVAGVVKRLKHRPVRRLALFYFFRLPMPEGFAERRYSDLGYEGETTPRSAFLPDPMGRYVYVLHFPVKDVRREKLTLTFSR